MFYLKVEKYNKILNMSITIPKFLSWVNRGLKIVAWLLAGKVKKYI